MCDTACKPGTVEYTDAVNQLIGTALGVGGALMAWSEHEDDYVAACAQVMMKEALFRAVRPFANGSIFDEESYQ